jgi:hypothetical protein
MIRLLAAAALAALTLPGVASAQTWGQLVYLNAYGRPLGGTPLSEVETRSYVATGRWADGYSDRPRVHVPMPGYGAPFAAARHGWSDNHGHRPKPYGHDLRLPRHASVHERPARPGYRDSWGYNDDRPPSARGWPDDRRGPRHDRDCGCADVYLYDR